jgi:hypothetical protein
MSYTIQTGQSTITVEQGDAPQTDVTVQKMGRCTVTIEDAPSPEAPPTATDPVDGVELSMGGIVERQQDEEQFNRVVLRALTEDAFVESDGNIQLAIEAGKAVFRTMTPGEKALRFFDAKIADINAELGQSPGFMETLDKIAQWPAFEGPVTLTAAELSISPSRRASANARYIESEEWIFNKSLPPR